MFEGKAVKAVSSGVTTVGVIDHIYETDRFSGINLPREPVWFIRIKVEPSEKDKALGASETCVSGYYAKGEWELLDS